MPRRIFLLVTALVLVLAWHASQLDPVAGWLRPRPPTVVFVVLDTVRADRLSACGYERPTSPTLERLVAGGASLSCEAWAPASWTLPSHASFMTGAELPEHGVDLDPSGEVRFAWDDQARVLEPRWQTLAERMAERGYRTVALSGNPVVSSSTGLLQGFHVQVMAADFGDLSGEGLAGALRDALRPLDARGGPPLFLFVNIADAHEPWQAVPEGLAWAPARPVLGFDPDDPDNLRRRYVRGELPPDEARALAAHLGDVYDYGVARADATLGRVLDVLEAGGWLEHRYRLVVTSDHGELLGEHGLIGHGGTLLYEPLIRVPLLVAGTDPPPVPEVISALAVHDLVLGGQPDHPPRTAAFPNPRWTEAYGRPERGPGAAVRTGDDKLTWRDGAAIRFDLAADPGEDHPLPAAGHPSLPSLEALVRGTEEALRRDAAVSDESTRQLQALGYLQ